MLGIPESSLHKRSYTGCPVNLNFVMLIILQWLIWVTGGRSKLPVAEQKASLALGLAWECVEGVLCHVQWKEKPAQPWLTTKSHKSRFLLWQQMLSSKMLCCLGGHEDMTSCQFIVKHAISSLRSWGFGIYVVGRDFFASDSQVKKRAVFSPSPRWWCMFRKQSGSCCQTLHYYLSAPDVLNALTCSTADLLQEWMKHFPGQDFMNETACVLQGRKLCIS